MIQPELIFVVFQLLMFHIALIRYTLLQTAMFFNLILNMIKLLYHTEISTNFD